MPKAWTYRDSSLVLTTAPVGERVLFRHAGARGSAKPIRADRTRGLTLVRVRRALDRPLWQRRQPAKVSDGEPLAVAGPKGIAYVRALSAHNEAITFDVAHPELAGAPVLNEAGRLVGVVGRNGFGIPIGRSCGKIRNC